MKYSLYDLWQVQSHSSKHIKPLIIFKEKVFVKPFHIHVGISTFSYPPFENIAETGIVNNTVIHPQSICIDKVSFKFCLLLNPVYFDYISTPNKWDIIFMKRKFGWLIWNTQIISTHSFLSLSFQRLYFFPPRRIILKKKSYFRITSHC